jgi:hypothetical protein
MENDRRYVEKISAWVRSLSFNSLGCVLINPALKALVAECPLRSEMNRNTACRDVMCQHRTTAKSRLNARVKPQSWLFHLFDVI